MLTRLFPFLDPDHITDELLWRLRSLADDCSSLERNPVLSPTLLQAAPLLDDYRPVLTPQGVRLIGQVSDHPLLGSSLAMTSQVWLADPKGQWVRTLSRFYRLGRPEILNQCETPEKHV